MSDDDLYADSAYDELEELLYDEVEPDVAGDLAEHTLYSPVYQDDPGYDKLNGYSDWEYYSDDYYDDDPALLKNNPQDGTSPRPRNSVVKRGRKRKLEETTDIPLLALDERRTLVQCVQGTIWAGPRLDTVKRYREGQAEKVALLKDWKKNFMGRNGNKTGKARGRNLRQDESWANNLSLEDMGLRYDKNIAAAGTELLNGQEVLGDTEDAHDGDESMGGGDQESSADADTFEDTTEFQRYPRKRRKQRAPSPPLPLQSDAGSTGMQLEDGQKETRESSQQPSTVERQNNDQLAPRSRGVPIPSAEANNISNSKRKRDTSPVQHEVSPGMESDVKSSGTRSRKRVVSSRLSTKALRDEERPPPIPTTRVTRSRKK